MARPSADVYDLPTTGPNSLRAPGEPAAGKADEQLADRADHEQQPDGIAKEARNTDHYAADEHDKPVEQVPGGQVSTLQPLLGAGEHPEADAPDDEGAEGAHDYQQGGCP